MSNRGRDTRAPNRSCMGEILRGAITTGCIAGVFWLIIRAGRR